MSNPQKKVNKSTAGKMQRDEEIDNAAKKAALVKIHLNFDRPRDGSEDMDFREDKSPAPPNIQFDDIPKQTTEEHPLDVDPEYNTKRSALNTLKLRLQR